MWQNPTEPWLSWLFQLFLCEFVTTHLVSCTRASQIQTKLKVKAACCENHYHQEKCHFLFLSLVIIYLPLSLFESSPMHLPFLSFHQRSATILWPIMILATSRSNIGLFWIFLWHLLLFINRQSLVLSILDIPALLQVLVVPCMVHNHAFWFWWFENVFGAYRERLYLYFFLSWP